MLHPPILLCLGVATLVACSSGDEQREPISRYVDLSHTIEHGMETYRGLPAPQISEHLTREASRGSYSPGTEFQIGRIDLVANTGTYIDTPFHRYADGYDLSHLKLATVAGIEVIVLRPELKDGQTAISIEALEGIDVAGKAVLIQTGWDRHWRTDQYFEGHPHLDETLAQLLVDQGAVIVGIDSLNIDDTSSGARPVHSVLLGAGIPIIEHMTNLAALPKQGAKLFAVPVKIADFGTFPVRAFGIVEE